jgi:hypothetical protein
MNATIRAQLLAIIFGCLWVISIVFAISLAIQGEQYRCESNIKPSESSQGVWTIKNRLNDHDLLILDDHNNEIILSVENAFDPCFEINSTIIYRQR